MKKRTKRVLPWWIVLGVVGIILIILGVFLPIPGWITGLTTILCWLGTAVWVTLHFVLGNKKKSSSGPIAGDRIVYKRVSQEINLAIERYLESVKRKGFLRRGALYERPWFLVCGQDKSGKSQLLSGSGLHFPLQYPTEQDGMMLADQSGISWNFGNDAVWVDVPGVLMNESGKDEWRATVSAIQNVRSERAIDGMVMTVNAGLFLNDDPHLIKQTASELRQRIDELIAAWGIEFPVFLVISRSDTIPGFNELFRDPAGKWNEQILGATLSGEQLRESPRRAFLKEFEILSESLKDLRLRMLAKEKTEERRRLICRFVIHFDGLQQKLGDFISELFKPSSYEGRPAFRGFYFTSCVPLEDDSPQQSNLQISVSNTIASHPLNPHRLKGEDKPITSTARGQQVRPFFTHTLFRDVIPGGSNLVKKTQRFSRREMLRHYGLSGLIFLVALVLGTYIFASGRKSIGLNNSVKKELQLSQGTAGTRSEVYKRLGRLGTTVSMLKQMEEKGAPLSMGLGMYKADKAYEPVKQEYFKKVNKYIVGPATQWLEYRIKRYTERSQELSGDDYRELYRTLKTYLSISEAVAGQFKLVDTAALHGALLESVKSALLTSKRGSRLSENVETILQNNIGLYLEYLKAGDFPLIQENQILVSRARRRLCRLPNAQTLYESVINRLSVEAPRLTLDEILSREGQGILETDQSISMLYTQDGWDHFVQKGLLERSKDPYKIDWVLGTAASQMPKNTLDPEGLYQDLLAVYFADVKSKWLAFLMSLSMEPFGDISRSGRILQKLGRDQSEIARLFEKVSELTHIKEQEEDGPEVPGVVSKMAKKKVKKLTKVKVDPTTFFKRKKGVEELSNAFKPFRSFVKSAGGSFEGFKGYQDKLLTLAEKLIALDANNGDKVVALFNGKESDPLLSAWNFTNGELAGLPDELSHAIRTLLLSPIEYTGTAVSNSLREHLNSLWHDDVFTPFTKRMAGRYPFIKRGDEALFDDVMDFFRPTTGVLWGFYDRRLSSFIIKRDNKWQVKKIGTVEVHFSPKLLTTLKRAEQIRDIFFQPDGTLRTQKLAITSSKSNKNSAIFIIADQEYKLEPAGVGDQIQFTWPNEAGSKGISLKIFANESAAKDFIYGGQWGLMRLFDDAKVNVLNKRSFNAKWHVNVQNIYMIYFVCTIRVSGSDHPFMGRFFEKFDCPGKITLEQKGTS